MTSSPGANEDNILLMKDVIDFMPKLYKIFNYQDVYYPPIHHSQDKLEEREEHTMRKNELDEDWLDKEVKSGVKKLIDELSAHHFKSEGERQCFEDIIERILCNGFEGSK